MWYEVRRTLSSTTAAGAASSPSSASPEREGRGFQDEVLTDCLLLSCGSGRQGRDLRTANRGKLGRGRGRRHEATPAERAS